MKKAWLQSIWRKDLYGTMAMGCCSVRQNYISSKDKPTQKPERRRTAALRPCRFMISIIHGDGRVVEYAGSSFTISVDPVLPTRIDVTTHLASESLDLFPGRVQFYGVAEKVTRP